MCDEFGEVSGIIDLVIKFLAAGTLFLNSYDTLSYVLSLNTRNFQSFKLEMKNNGSHHHDPSLYLLNLLKFYPSLVVNPFLVASSWVKFLIKSM